MQRGALLLFSLLAANSQFSVLIRQKMQLTGWDNSTELDAQCDVRGHTNFNRVALLSIPYTVVMYSGIKLVLPDKPFALIFDLFRFLRDNRN